MLGEIWQTRSVAARDDDRPTPRVADAVLTALLAQLPVGVVIADAAGRQLHANDAARRLRRSADAGRAAAPSAAVDLALARALLTGEVVRDEEVEYRDADGRRRWLRVSATPVRGAAGEVEVGVLTFDDVTAERCADAWRPAVEALARL